MNKKERVIAAINFKTVDRIPTHYRGIPFLTENLMKYYGIEDYWDFERNYKLLLEKMGADFFSAGDNISAFSTFNPSCNAPDPKSPYVKEESYFFVLGINSKIVTIDKYNYKYHNIGINPPLANLESASELEEDFLMPKLDYFNFNQIVNRRLFDQDKFNRRLEPKLLTFKRFKGSYFRYI